jgi:hypothetical protein
MHLEVDHGVLQRLGYRLVLLEPKWFAHHTLHVKHHLVRVDPLDLGSDVYN